MTTERILNRIIDKGGLPGACAHLLRNDKTKAKLFIKECHSMCHTSTAKRLWGDELIETITKYTQKKIALNENKITSFDLKVANTVKSIRSVKRYKQTAIAEALGMSQSYYSKMEKGVKPISVGQLDIIAKQLHTSITDILSICYNGPH
jgi:DNA-binding Xre family transcriptional regulator